jgi:hypothetical protein
MPYQDHFAIPLSNGKITTDTIDKTVTRQQVIDCYLKHNKIVKVVNELKLYFDDVDDPSNKPKWYRMTRKDIEHHFQVDLNMERSKSINRFLMEQLKQQTSQQ